MAEDFDVIHFDVILSEKTYTPDHSAKQNSWIGDYTTAYEEFTKDPDAFWDKAAKELYWFTLQRNSTGSLLTKK